MKDAEGAGPAKTTKPWDERVGDPSLETVSHWRMVALVSGLGTLRIDLARDQVLLDAMAVTQQGLAPPESREMTLDFWLGLFSEADQLRMHATVTGVVSANPIFSGDGVFEGVAGSTYLSRERPCQLPRPFLLVGVQVARRG